MPLCAICVAYVLYLSSKAIKVDWAVPDDQPLQRCCWLKETLSMPSCGEFSGTAKIVVQFYALDVKAAAINQN